RRGRAVTFPPLAAETIKKAGISPGLSLFLSREALLELGALRRGGGPRLDQRVVVDGLPLRLFVGKLALRRNVAVLRRLVKPILRSLLLVELRSAGALHTGLFKTFEHGVLGRGQRVHRLLRRLVSGRRIADVLPPQLRKLRIVRHVVASRGPL